MSNFLEAYSCPCLRVSMREDEACSPSRHIAQRRSFGMDKEASESLANPEVFFLACGASSAWDPLLRLLPAS